MAEALKMKVDTEDKETFESYNLPDARDGLTPRQRRILWTMRKRKLSSRTEYEMTARTLYDAGGHVGTTSDRWGFGEADVINDTIAKMTQHFNTVALIEAGAGTLVKPVVDQPLLVLQKSGSAHLQRMQCLSI